MRNRTLLVVEDDESVRALVEAHLRKEGAVVEGVGSGREMMARLDKGGVDLVVLDLSLPDEDGLALARRVRIRSQIPIVILSGRSDDENKLAGLELGADDYVTKPFNPQELVLRIRNVLARYHGAPTEEEVKRFAGWTLDIKGRVFRSPAGEAIELTRAEFNILSALAMAGGRVVNRQQLLDAVARYEQSPHYRTVDVLIYRLRNKIEEDPRNPRIIVTLPGVGYRLAVPVE